MKCQLILFAVIPLSFFPAKAGLALEPRFFAVSANFSDKLISFYADGQIASSYTFPDGFAPHSLATDGTDIYTLIHSNGTTAARRPVDSTEMFSLVGDVICLSGSSSCTAPQIQLDNDADIYVTHDRGELMGSELLRLDATGTVTLQHDLPDQIFGIDADAMGNIYVTQQLTESSVGSLWVFSAAGDLQSTMPHPLPYPSALVVDDLNQRLYLGGQTGTIAVMDISAESPALIDSWDVPGIALVLDVSLDRLTGHLFVAGLGGVVEFDTDGVQVSRPLGAVGTYTGIAASPLPSGDGQDYNGDDRLDAVDLDAMVRAIAGGQNPLDFDMSGDGRVNSLDRDAWLNAAAAENLPAGMAYALGDANLDGLVDRVDFEAWNANKFRRVAAWSKGDFNGDGLVDGSDFILWNENKLLNTTTQSTVPEPQAVLLLLLGTALCSKYRVATVATKCAAVSF